VPRSLLKNWLGLSRTRLFVAVTVPAVLGGAVAERDGSFSVGTLLLVLVGLVLVESSNLFFGDWTAREGKSLLPGSNPPPTIEGSPLIAERILPSRLTLYASALCLLSAAAVLAYFALTRGWPILLLGSLAVLIGFFYALSPIKYGFFSTALLPPLLTLSADFVFTGRFTLVAFLAGLPLLFSSAGVIYTYRVLYVHSANTGSFSARLRLLVLLYCLTFLSVVLLDVCELLPATTALALLALPILFYLVARSEKERLDYVPVTSLGVLLYTVTGLLLALGFILNW
jgi:1,4-dihydroxy-2-naphthoate octaprenyltransferase